MSKVLCFSLADREYLDVIKIGLYTYAKYNSHPLKVFVTDGSADQFRAEINYDNVEFINYDLSGSQCYTFYNDHKNLFDSRFYFWDNDHIPHMLVANEILDELLTTYSGAYEVILRLDLDVMFYSSIDDSIDKFIESGCCIGGNIENRVSVGVTTPVRDYINAGSFLFRTNHEDIVRNHTEQMFRLLEKTNRIYYFPDQDSLNVIYNTYDKFNLNICGWIIAMMRTDDLMKLNTNDVFVHYAGPGKPFRPTNDNTKHPLRATYPRYLELANSAKCSDDFILRISDCIKSLQPADDETRIPTVMFTKHFKGSTCTTTH